MLPDLEKIVAADQRAQAALTQAQKEAQALRAQADSQVQAIQASLQAELAQVRQEAEDEILRQAGERAAEISAASERYLQKLAEKQEARREEAVAFLMSRVLAP